MATSERKSSQALPYGGRQNTILSAAAPDAQAIRQARTLEGCTRRSGGGTPMNCDHFWLMDRQFARIDPADRHERQAARR